MNEFSDCIKITNNLFKFFPTVSNIIVLMPCSIVIDDYRHVKCLGVYTFPMHKVFVGVRIIEFGE